jgi:hypothetical protein
MDFPTHAAIPVDVNAVFTMHMAYVYKAIDIN